MEDGDAPTLEQLSLWYGELKLVHKRLHDEYDASQVENKRFKTATSNVVDELLCPITQQLPVDPVMAKDGRLYERVAINEWFEKNKWKKWLPYPKNAEVELVRSPITNQEMELHLIDAAQNRITIQHLVQSGLVDDDKAEAVKEFFALEKAINKGDGDAMYEMGRRYGQDHWWKKGAKLHNPKCMAAYGRFLRLENRSGILSNLGTRYLCEAATNVDLAAYTIGKAVLAADYLLEDAEIKTKLDEAKYWLKKVVHGECEHKILGEADMLDAQKKLKEIEEHEREQ
mgnify:CR=1 FL=1